MSTHCKAKRLLERVAPVIAAFALRAFTNKFRGPYGE